MLNFCFLNYDVPEGPYIVECFRASLNKVGVLKDTKWLPPYKTNNFGLMTLKTAEERHRLLAARQLCTKGKKCYAHGPNRAEVRLKVHWDLH